MEEKLKKITIIWTGELKIQCKDIFNKNGIKVKGVST